MHKTDESLVVNMQRVNKWFGDFHALKYIYLSIYEGERIVVCGPAGSGKSTLIRCLNGLEKHQDGTIKVHGTVLDDNTESVRKIRKSVGMVFQQFNLFPHLTVMENCILAPMENLHLSEAEASKLAMSFLERVQIPAQANKLPGRLSGGQQQRIPLARAIAAGPGLLLLDEPLSALDAKVRVYLRHEIKTLQQKLGVTTIMVTHDQEEALSMADRIVVINEGKVEQIGTPNEVYCKPETLFVADFIGEMTQFRGIITGKSSIKIGNTELNTAAHQFDEGREVSLTIRPEDIIPLGAKPPTKNGLSNSRNNVFSTKLVEMEFLGSFWRCKLKSDEFSQALVTADFSVNAVRRLSLEPNQNLWIELPSESILAFDNQAA